MSTSVTMSMRRGYRSLTHTEMGGETKDAIGHSSVPKQQNELLYGTVYYLYTIMYSRSQIAPVDSCETPVDCKSTTTATIWKSDNTPLVSGPVTLAKHQKLGRSKSRGAELAFPLPADYVTPGHCLKEV